MDPYIIDEKLASRLKAVSRARVLETASDALFRTMQSEQMEQGSVDPRLVEAHKRVRDVIEEWKGGGSPRSSDAPSTGRGKKSPAGSPSKLRSTSKVSPK